MPPADRSPLRGPGGERPQRVWRPPPLNRVEVLKARIRDELTARKLNWLQAFAIFDRSGKGVLPQDDFGAALASLNLGLSQAEVDEVWKALRSPNGGVQVVSFHAAVREPPPMELAGQQDWMTQKLLTVAQSLQDKELGGTLTGPGPTLLKALSAESGRGSIREDRLLRLVGPHLADPEDQARFVLMCPKNLLGEVDIATTIARYIREAKSVGVPSMLPPLPNAPDSPTKPKSDDAPAPRVGPPLRMEVGREHLTRASMARLRHRMRARDVDIEEVLRLFGRTKPRHVSAGELDEMASTLPLGTSRAESSTRAVCRV